MINQATETMLKAMKMTGMANELARQNANPKSVREMSFDERLAQLVDAEWRKRQASKLEKCMKDACLRYRRAQIEDIEYYPDRKLDKSMMNQLATCSFVDHGHHIILHGDSGNGKTFIGCALGNAACRRFKRVRYIRMQELLESLELARLEGNYRKTVNAYRKLDLPPSAANMILLTGMNGFLPMMITKTILKQKPLLTGLSTTRLTSTLKEKCPCASGTAWTLRWKTPVLP